MGPSNNKDNEDLLNFFKDANEKLEKFTSILEKFGLDIITKMGQTNLKISALTNKINDLSKATIDVKALLPQLTNVIENQKILEAELDLIRTLIQRSDISIQHKEIEGEKIERDPSATDKKQSIIKQFNNLKSYIEEKDDPKPVIECLENIKEDIFVFTGGHRILYEIAQFSNRLNGMETLTNGVRENLKEKIIFWINKLTVKG